MTRARHTVLILTLAAVSAPWLFAQNAGPDWPQFRGPNRDGVVASFTEPAVWPERLTRRWRVEVGAGYATPILVGGRLYVFARQGDDEVLQALDAVSGKTIWRTQYAAPAKVDRAAEPHGLGPKSTPAFANGRIYTLGIGGIVTAFAAEGGKIVWQRPADTAVPLYGTAASPLVDGGVAIVHVGGHDRGALTAFDANTGQVRWSWSGDGPSYGSPIVATIDGVRQIVTLTQENLVGVAAASGQLLWRRPYATEFTQNIITPIFSNGMLFVGGYQKPTEALRIARTGGTWQLEDAWESPSVSLYMANAVVAGNALFGFSHRNRGQYFLLDLKTGAPTWTGAPRQAENAAIVRAGNTLFSLEDGGELVVGRVAGTAFREVRRYTVADSATWALPVISANRVFVKDADGLALWVW
jgi:outer membrane protein assembly factor BamB